VIRDPEDDEPFVVRIFNLAFVVRGDRVHHIKVMIRDRDQKKRALMAGHGTRSRYTRRKCRCKYCVAANTRYAQELRRRSAAARAA
jgi:hypothetical protein